MSTPLTRQQSQPLGQRCPLQRLPPPPPPPPGKQNPLRHCPSQQSRLEPQRPPKPLQRPRRRLRRRASDSPSRATNAAAAELPSKSRSAPRRVALSRRRWTTTDSRSKDSPVHASNLQSAAQPPCNLDLEADEPPIIALADGTTPSDTNYNARIQKIVSRHHHSRLRAAHSIPCGVFGSSMSWTWAMPAAA